MQPRFGKLAPCGLQQHRYVAAADGLYLQARTRTLDLCVPIARFLRDRLPYGELQPWVRLAGGRIPQTIREALYREAVAAAPQEFAALVLFDTQDGYRLHLPSVEECSRGHVRYSTQDYDPESVVLDVHSHGYGHAYFSPTDDADDAAGGIYIALVLGRCRQAEQVTEALRLVVNGHLLSLPLDPWQSEDLHSEGAQYTGTESG